MAGAKIISLALCCFGVFKSLQPHHLFIDQSILTYYRNITEEELHEVISPVKDYACLILLVLIVLVTDYVKYKPVIILQGFFSVIFIALFTWDHQFVPLLVSKVFQGFVISTNISYYAYIFAIVDTEQYKLNVSLSQGSVLFGTFLGNLLAVLFTSLNITELQTLNYISVAFSFLSLMVTLLLPHVQPRIPTTREIIERELQAPNGLSDIPQKSPWEVDRRTSHISTDTQGIIDTYTHINDPAFTSYARPNMYSDIDTSSLGFYGDYSVNEQRYTSSIGSESLDTGSITSRGENPVPPIVEAPQPVKTHREKLTKFVNDLKKAYSEKLVICWSSWLVISVCGYGILNKNFSRLLDETIPERSSPMVYDPGVVTLATLLALLPVMIFAIIKGTLTIYSEPLIVLLSLSLCVFLTVLANTQNIWLAYAFYILFYVIYEFSFVLALYQIGNVLQSRRYGFIFGINLFLAVLLKLLLITLLDNKHLLHTSVSLQITVGGAIFGLYGLCFLSKILYSILVVFRQNGRCCGNQSNPQDRDLLVASTS